MKVKIDVNIFKDAIGRWRTQSLFVETARDPDKYPPLFLLTEENDRDGYVSMKRIYMEQEDPTEYKAAMAMFGTWEPWENLLSSPFFKPVIAEWRKQLALKLRSAAIEKIIETGVAGGKLSGTQYQAAKWLAEQGWNSTVRPPQGILGNEEGGGPTSSSGPGRPSKAAISSEAERRVKEALAELEITKSDAERLGIEI